MRVVVKTRGEELLDGGVPISGDQPDPSESGEEGQKVAENVGIDGRVEPSAGLEVNSHERELEARAPQRSREEPTTRDGVGVDEDALE